MVGLEIGALDKPIVLRSEGQIFYVDYLDTPSLKERYRRNPVPDCNVENIVDVDAVWGENTILEALGGVKVDYVLASHVGEHVPDFISWLKEICDVLKPGGTIRLALPDKRYCFDHLREETRLTDLLTAYFLRARRPQPQQIIDFCLHFHAINAGDAWKGAEIRPQISSLNQLDHAFAMAKLSKDGIYHDVHCWAFTPSSLAKNMEQITSLGLLNLSCESLIETEPDGLEFFVTMRKTQGAAAASWARLDRDHFVFHPLRNDGWRGRIARHLRLLKLTLRAGQEAKTVTLRDQT
jgi:hypothetical protein